MSVAAGMDREYVTPDATLNALRQERQRKASWSVAVSYLARGLSLVISLVSVPLTLNYLDKERYGLWLLIGSVIAYLNVTDLGLGLGLQNRIAEARGRGEMDKIGSWLSTAFGVMLAVGVGVALVGAAISWVAPIGAWFHISSSAVENEVRGALMVMALTFAYLLPVRMITSAQNAFQEAYWAGLWSIGGSVMSLVALLIVIATKGTMVWLALTTFLLAQVMSVVNIWQFFRRHPEALVSWRKIDRRLLRPLFALSWQFFVISLYTLVIWNIDNLVIVAYKGPEAVVSYAVAFRLMWVMLTMLNVIPNALWPAYSEAAARGDWPWVDAMHRHTTLLTVALATVIGVVFVVWGQEFILAWAGPRAQGTLWMMAGLALTLVLTQWNISNGILISAIGWPRFVLVEGIFDAMTKLGASLLLIRVWDVAGVAWGTALAACLVPSWYLVWGIRRVTAHQVEPPWRKTLFAVLLIGAVGLGGGWFMSGFLPFTWPLLLRLAVGAGLTTSLASGVLWYGVLSKDYRGQLAYRFVAILRSVRTGAGFLRVNGG